jgi:hypothetical protein
MITDLLKKTEEALQESHRFLEEEKSLWILFSILDPSLSPLPFHLLRLKSVFEGATDR